MRFKIFMGVSRLFAAAAVASLLLAGTVSAQSPSAAIQGQLAPGDVAVIQNLDTGFTREVKPNAKGKFQLRNLPTGTFSVSVKHPDGTIGESRVVTLRVGMTARFP
ncbi:MAG: hypothetical protein A3E01_05125 [Gammaproteobacteria bacterium RIFCSPHIGHO2_12_FULL_63_22]|nr:MAG: hypothetical protein A3E01_05125 [Gammaproteobacteria bacterium RIFCSPHIGHO2_12_FULL_63_22]